MLRRALKQHREKRRQRRMAAQQQQNQPATGTSVPAAPASSKEEGDLMDVTLNPPSSSNEGSNEGPPAGTWPQRESHLLIETYFIILY